MGKIQIFSFSTLKLLVLAQLLSFLLCCVAVSNTGLNVWYKTSAPCFLAFMAYTLLACTFGAKLVASEGFLTTLKQRGWKYFIVAVFDVEANFLMNKSYNYTTLTSVQLLDGFAIPCVVVLSLIFLKTRFGIIHYIGVVLCICGNVILVLTDRNNEDNDAPNPLLGDLLAISAAFLYGCSNTAQEYMVKKQSATEFIGMLSLFASVISGIQVYIVERNVPITLETDWKVGCLLVLFVGGQYAFYVVTPFVMQKTSATLVNLSLITADFGTLVIGIYLFKYKFSFYFIIAFTSVILGLILYNLKPVKHMVNNDELNLENSTQIENVIENTDANRSNIKA